MIDIGTIVFVPWASTWTRVERPCPMCAGKRIVTLILGSGEHQPVECGFCSPGFRGPTGVVEVSEAASGIREIAVCGFLRDQEGRVKYFDESASSIEESAIYTDRAAAEAQRLVLDARARERAQELFESQFTDSKGKISWTAGYHRSQIKELRRKLKWHEDKLKPQEAAE